MKRNINIGDLKTKGFVNISYSPELRSKVTVAMTSWMKFCSSAENIKNKFVYSSHSDGVGYELKNGTGPSADRKENFDIALLGGDQLNKVAGDVGYDNVSSFIESGLSLVEFIKPVVSDFAKESERAFGLDGFQSEVDDSEQAFFVRFIHYFGDRTAGQEIATAHTDQSGFTLHLFESHPGLQCLTYGDSSGQGRQWMDMPVSDGQTVIIPSMQMQLRSNGQIKALCHRVVATEDTATHGRYSAVCFVQLAKNPKYNKEKHGRLQEKVPGFNYDMEHQEFSKMFKS